MNAEEIQLAYYDKFFFSRELEPYPVQERAADHVFQGRNLLVTVPTGTGKTMMGKAAIFRALQMGRTAIYTTPLRALTEEKFRELCEDFGEDNVGFATGDYKVRPKAPIQVVVAEILWNQVFAGKTAPADVVVMDEGHYFNEAERGYVWEQSIIGLHPATQLVILSATVGNPQAFCNWVAGVRRVNMELVESHDRKVPLVHEYREAYLVETVKDLFANGEYPTIIFVFGRVQCYEQARLLRSCPRFTTDEEREEIGIALNEAMLPSGGGKELEPLLLHGIGVHHAGVLPRYKRVVEELTVRRLIKFVVSTETIAAGINLPAKRVVFPSLRKFIKRQARLLTSAEYHQMSGRAGRPQFDKEGIAIALAPDNVVQEFRKEIKNAKKRGANFDEAKIKKSVWAKAKSAAAQKNDILWDEAAHQSLIAGEPAPLASRSKVTAEMILTIGLPDLSADPPPPDEPASMHLDARTVTDNLLLSEGDKVEARKQMEQIVANLQALDVIDEKGQQVGGKMIGECRGMDGPFVYYSLKNHDFDSTELRQLVEYLVDHNVIHRKLQKKEDAKRKAWILERLREKRKEAPQTSFEDVEEDYEREFPRELSKVEKIHQEFTAKLPHPELHGGKVAKNVWGRMQDEELSFLDFVVNEDLAREEGSLFSYLARVMKSAKLLFEVTHMSEFQDMENAVRDILVPIDPRVIDKL